MTVECIRTIAPTSAAVPGWTEQAAKAELDDARATKQSADEARADAERLSDLTEEKKQERQQD